MKIYIAHTRDFDFKKDLYQPIRKSKLNELAEIIMPHEENDEPFDSKDCLKKCDYVIAEVSYPSISLGIEMGWADMNQVKIIAIYKKASRVTDSMKVVIDELIEYSDSEDLVSKLMNVFKDN